MRYQTYSKLSLLIMAAFAALLVLSSCNPAQRVINNQKKFDQVGEYWAKLHPCDSGKTVYVQGKNDSVFFQIPVNIKDTIGLQDLKDSLNKALRTKYNELQQDCSKQVNDAYDVGYQQALTEVKKIKIPAPRVDTIKITGQRDFTMVSKQLDEANEKNKVLQIQVSDEKTATASASGKAKTRFWILIVAGVVIAGLTYLLIRKKAVTSII